MNNDNNPPKDPMDQFMPIDSNNSAVPGQASIPAPSDPVAMPSMPGAAPVADPVMPTMPQPDLGAATPPVEDTFSLNITPPAAAQSNTVIPSSDPVLTPAADAPSATPAMSDSTPAAFDAAPADSATQPSSGDPVLDELHKIENKLDQMDEKL